jgi:guanylate kinase
MSSEARPRPRLDPAEGPPSGLLLVLSAPSGAGKTTLAHRFLAAHAEAVFSVSVTTRAPRGAERDGVDYHFVSPERFAALVAEGAFAEWAEVHGRRYGTLRATVEETLQAGRIAVFDIDVQGGEQLKAAFGARAATVLILTPDAAELERRLRGRSTDAEEVIRQRMVVARQEVARGLASYDYVVLNESIDEALGRIEAIVAAERARLAGGRDAAAETLANRCRRGVAALAGWKSSGGA